MNDENLVDELNAAYGEAASYELSDSKKGFQRCSFDEARSAYQDFLVGKTKEFKLRVLRHDQKFLRHNVYEIKHVGY